MGAPAAALWPLPGCLLALLALYGYGTFKERARRGTRLTIACRCVVVHPHPDGRRVVAAALEEVTCVVVGLLDQLVRSREVDRSDGQRARRGKDDQVDLVAMQLDVCDQPLLCQQRDRVERHPECSTRWVLERARVAGRQDVDAVGADVDRV